MGWVNDKIPQFIGVTLVYNCGHTNGQENKKVANVDGDCLDCVMRHRIALYVDHARRYDLPLLPVPADATLGQLKQWRDAYHCRHQIWCMVQELKSQIERGYLPPEHYNVGEEVNLIQSELQEFSGSDAWQIWTEALLAAQEAWFNSLFATLVPKEKERSTTVAVKGGAITITAIPKKPRAL